MVFVVLMNLMEREEKEEATYPRRCSTSEALRLWTRGRPCCSRSRTWSSPWRWWWRIGHVGDVHRWWWWSIRYCRKPRQQWIIRCLLTLWNWSSTSQWSRRLPVKLCWSIWSQIKLFKYSFMQKWSYPVSWGIIWYLIATLKLFRYSLIQKWSVHVSWCIAANTLKVIAKRATKRSAKARLT